MFPTGSQSNRVVLFVHTNLRCADMIFNFIFIIKWAMLYLYYTSSFINNIVKGEKFDIVG